MIDWIVWILFLLPFCWEMLKPFNNTTKSKFWRLKKSYDCWVSHSCLCLKSAGCRQAGNVPASIVLTWSANTKLWFWRVQDLPKVAPTYYSAIFLSNAAWQFCSRGGVHPLRLLLKSPVLTCTSTVRLDLSGKPENMRCWHLERKFSQGILGSQNGGKGKTSVKNILFFRERC